MGNCAGIFNWYATFVPIIHNLADSLTMLGFLETVSLVWLIPCEVESDLNRLMERIGAAAPGLHPLLHPELGAVAITR